VLAKDGGKRDTREDSRHCSLKKEASLTCVSHMRPLPRPSYFAMAARVRRWLFTDIFRAGSGTCPEQSSGWQK
jgi:hypothetical protein